MSLQPGLSAEKRFTVDDDLATDVAGSVKTKVLATPRMIAVMERTAMRAIWDRLPEGATCVGYAVNIKHVSSAPFGGECVSRAELTGIRDGRKLHFKVEVTFDGRTVGVGTHERRIIGSTKFNKRNEDA